MEFVHWASLYKEQEMKLPRQYQVVTKKATTCANIRCELVTPKEHDGFQFKKGYEMGEETKMARKYLFLLQYNIWNFMVGVSLLSFTFWWVIELQLI